MPRHRDAGKDKEADEIRRLLAFQWTKMLSFYPLCKRGLDAALQRWQMKAPSRKEDKMGVMTRDRGEVFVITSDQNLGGTKDTRVAKSLSSIYLVWTGESWSPVMSDAKTFETGEAADKYIRANSDRVMKDG